MHRLDGPRLKVRRAESEIDAFRRAEDIFRKQTNNKIVKAEFNPKTGKDVYRVSMKVSPPLEWGVLIGEIAHNLRSALDGLVYQLALLETDTPAWDTGFPVFLRGHTVRRKRKGGGLLPHFKGEGTSKRRKLGDGEKMIQSLREEHQALIEGLQPYKSGRGGKNSPLWHLYEINNADKHRLIQGFGIKPAGLSWGGWGGDVEQPSFPRSRAVVLKDGAKFCEFSPSVTVHPKLFPLIAFSEGCPPVKDLTVRLTFGLILKDVSKFIEGFAPEFE
jgi:hypothetical protein